MAKKKITKNKQKLDPSTEDISAAFQDLVVVMGWKSDHGVDEKSSRKDLIAEIKRMSGEFEPDDVYDEATVEVLSKLDIDTAEDVNEDPVEVDLLDDDDDPIDDPEEDLDDPIDESEEDPEDEPEDDPIDESEEDEADAQTIELGDTVEFEEEDGSISTGKVVDTVSDDCVMVEFDEGEYEIDIADLKLVQQKEEKKMSPKKNAAKKKPEKKTEEKKATKTKPKKQSKEKYPRMYAIADAIKESKTAMAIDAWTKKADALFVKKDGKSNLKQTEHIIKSCLPMLLRAGFVKDNGKGKYTC